MTARKRRRSYRPADTGNTDYEDSDQSFFEPPRHQPFSKEFYEQQQPPHYGRTE